MYKNLYSFWDVGKSWKQFLPRFYRMRTEEAIEVLERMLHREVVQVLEECVKPFIKWSSRCMRRLQIQV